MGWYATYILSPCFSNYYTVGGIPDVFQTYATLLGRVSMTFLSGLLKLDVGENHLEISVTTTHALHALTVADFAV